MTPWPRSRVTSASAVCAPYFRVTPVTERTSAQERRDAVRPADHLESTIRKSPIAPLTGRRRRR